MSPEITGILGILLMFLLLVLRMYIGMAMALVGFLGLWFLIGFDAGISILARIAIMAITTRSSIKVKVCIFTRRNPVS